MIITVLLFCFRVNVDLPGLSEMSSDVKRPKIDLDKEEDFGKAKLIAPRPKRNGLFYHHTSHIDDGFHYSLSSLIYAVSFKLSKLSSVKFSSILISAFLIS